MSASFYYVWGACGSLCLYYKSGTPQAAQVIMSPEKVAQARAEGVTPELAAMLYLSDAFGERNRRHADGELLDDGAEVPEFPED